MLCEYGLETHGLRGHEYYVLQDAHTLVTMHNVYSLANQYLTNQWERIKESDECYVTITNRFVRHVVNFHSVSHVSDTTSGPLKLIGYKSDLMTALDQALAELVAMRLDTAKFWKRKVGAN